MTDHDCITGTKRSQIHLAWTAFQRRQDSMGPLVGFDCWFLPVPKKGAAAKLLSYARNFYRSVRDLLKKKPEAVWVQLPQIPALWAALTYRALAGWPVKIVADCHNAQLRRPWSSFPLALWSLGRADVILVHNEAMFVQAERLGWPMDKVRVLEDVPPTGKEQAPSGVARRHIAAPKPWVLFPGSFAADEPIREVFEAARLAPDLTFIITGRPENAVRNGHQLEAAPPNVVMPGFLPVEVFDDLLREADVVVGLTREEGIQLSVCNEAIGFGRPLVTSDTVILRQMFAAAAVLVDTRNPASIVAGCQEALAHPELRSSLSVELAARRLKDWGSVQLANVMGMLSGSA